MDKDIVWLDYAKVLGIFLVIFGHLLQRFPLWEENVKFLWNYIYLFHMPLFFVISGYLFPKKKAAGITNVKRGRLSENPIALQVSSIHEDSPFL